MEATWLDDGIVVIDYNGVSVEIYTLGAFVFTILAKVAIEDELGGIGKHKNIMPGVGNAGELDEKAATFPMQ